MLNCGGIVFGACFDERLNIIHRYVDNIADLEILRRSKYVESFIGDSFKQAKEFLDAGKIVLFSGVQCQIHALNSFLRKPYPNLLTIEVICNSIPSARVWEIYKESLLSENGEQLIDFNFRGKDYGWEGGIFAVKTKTKTKTKTIPHSKSAFFNAFLSHHIVRESCGECLSKAFVSGADFTLGDFWGISNHHADFSDSKGISCIIVHNQKALDILREIRVCAEILPTTLLNIISGNPATMQNNPLPANRTEVLREFFSAYHKNGTDSAMKVLEAQNPRKKSPLKTLARHYYRALRGDPILRALIKLIKPAKRKTYEN